jgi:hypothetical protein
MAALADLQLIRSRKGRPHGRPFCFGIDDFMGAPYIAAMTKDAAASLFRRRRFTAARAR